jgi:opacity protein-like surface antigen
MRKNLLFLVCASLVFTAATAVAGTYGEREERLERPLPPPARPMARTERRVEVQDVGRPGPYLQAGGVYAFENFGGFERFAVGPGNTDIAHDNSWGYQVRGGYRVHPMVAVETEWEHYLDFESDPDRGSPGDFAGLDLEAWMLSANGKFYPLDGRIQPYALFGMGWQHAEFERGDNWELNDDAFALRFGVGVDVYFTEMIGMAAEGGYVLPVTGELADEDVDIIPLSVSVFVRFM